MLEDEKYLTAFGSKTMCRVSLCRMMSGNQLQLCLQFRRNKQTQHCVCHCMHLVILEFWNIFSHALLHSFLFVIRNVNVQLCILADFVYSVSESCKQPLTGSLGLT